MQALLGPFVLLLLHGPVVRAATVADRFSLDAYLRSLGFGAPREEGHVLRYATKWTSIEFEAGSRRIALNGKLIYLNGAIAKSGDVWSLPECDIRDVIDPILYPARALASQRCRLVVLDPGHGGDDNGASSACHVEEKIVTLDLAKRVQAKLLAEGVNVQMTRDKDEAVSLENRTARAIKLGADVFVSIHMNSAANRAVAGVETYVVPAAGFPSTKDNGSDDANKCIFPANRFDAANTLLAYYVQTGVISYADVPDRGVRRARYYVVRNVPCAAVLVECGFLSNTGDENLIRDRAHRDAIAEGIARGILTYSVRVQDAHPSAN